MIGSKYLSAKSKSFIIILSFVLVLIIGVFDYITGNEIASSIVYLLPIAISAWYVGKRSGFFISIISALTWITADLYAGGSYSHPLIPVWNTLVRFGLFIIITELLSGMKQSLEREYQLARTDPLTCLSNTRAFQEFAAKEINRAARYKRPFTIAYIDIDNFKVINDTLGHHAGNTLLRVMADTLQKNIRATDIASRLGGDEFVVILPETGEEQAKTAIDKIQKSLMDTMKANNWSVTFSIGLATCIVPPCSVDEMLRLADNLMYSVKSCGKNAVKHEVFGK
jgi:diguanylate cyclase (GGDEF)-like protein